MNHTSESPPSPHDYLLNYINDKNNNFSNEEISILTDRIEKFFIYVNILKENKGKFLYHAKKASIIIDHIDDSMYLSTEGKINKIFGEIKTFLEDIKTEIENIYKSTTKEQKYLILFQMYETVQQESKKIEILLNNIQESEQLLQTKIKECEKISKELEDKVSAASRIGLSSKFTKKHEDLVTQKNTCRNWFIACLILLLASGILLLVFFNNEQNIIQTYITKALILMPIIWATWFTSRQYINTNRLLEDYSFKATAAMSFESYKEAAQIDPQMQKELLRSAIQIFSENPTRLLSKHECASPLQEALQILNITDKISKNK